MLETTQSSSALNQTKFIGSHQPLHMDTYTLMSSNSVPIVGSGSANAYIPFDPYDMEIDGVNNEAYENKVKEVNY